MKLSEFLEKNWMENQLPTCGFPSVLNHKRMYFKKCLESITFFSILQEWWILYSYWNSIENRPIMSHFLQCSLSFCLPLHLSASPSLSLLLPPTAPCPSGCTTSALWEASLFIYIILQQISWHLSPLLLWPALLSEPDWYTFFHMSIAPFLNT